MTGKKQHVAMSVDQQMALGLQAAPQMAEKMGGDVDASQDPCGAGRRSRRSARPQ